MMDLRAAVQALVARRTDELVIVPFTGGIAWEDASSLPALDLPFWGSMGKAGSTGLGVALAVPTLRVWVLDGDGSLLMNLGTLVTEASQAPRNFYHFVLENGVYRTTGGQPIPGHEQVSFAGLARGAGFPHVCEFDDLAALERDLPAVVARPDLRHAQGLARAARPPPAAPHAQSSAPRGPRGHPGTGGCGLIPDPVGFTFPSPPGEDRGKSILLPLPRERTGVRASYPLSPWERVGVRAVRASDLPCRSTRPRASAAAARSAAAGDARL